MHVWKCYVALIAVLSLVLPMAGCNTDPFQTNSNTTGTVHAGSNIGEPTTTIPSNPEPVISIQYLPEAVENPDNLPVLKWVCLTEKIYGGGNRTWNETAVHELNQMLADKAMPFRIQFVMLTMDQWLAYSDWFSRSEAQEVLKDADLIYGVMRSKDILEYLSPITKYVTGDAEPSLKNAVPHEANWLSGTINGEIYGIRTIPVNATSNGWVVNSDLMSACGMTEKDFSKDFWEMDEIFQKIYSQMGEKPFLYVQNDCVMTTVIPFSDERETFLPGCSELFPSTIEPIGSCFGVDHSSEVPTVVNMMETSAVRKIQQAVKRYRNAGYIVDPNSQLDSVKISYATTTGNTAYTKGKDTVIPVTGSCVKATDTCGYMTGIAAVSEYKDEAVMLLHQISEDETFRMQLFYGKEGRDYKIENGYYTIVKQTDRSTYSLSMLSPLAYFSGLTANRQTAMFESPGAENWEYHVQTEKTALQTNQETLDSADSYYYPIVFDFSGFEKELEMIESVGRKSFAYFTNYATVGKPGDPDYKPEMTEKLYNQMLQEFRDAGSEKIIAELQRQLDTWLKENPDW